MDQREQVSVGRVSVKTPSYIRTGREGRGTTWKINREEGGRVWGDGSAGSRPELSTLILGTKVPQSFF
jgi:hypothetical protein